MYPGLDSNGWGYYENNHTTGVKYNGTSSNYGVTYSLGSVIGVALDCDAGTLTFYNNGISQGIAYSNLPIGTVIYPMMGNGSGQNENATTNFGATSFAYAMPSGYTAIGTTYWQDNPLKIKTTISSMVIGDVIPCRYTALTSGVPGYLSELGTCVATPIPVAGTATPDGLFYLIHSGFDTKGKIKLIPDRNLQTSISWDAINSTGLVNDMSISSYSGNVIPIMTSNIAPSGVASASSVGANLYPYLAMNRGVGGNDCWLALGTVDWLCYQFATSKRIAKYTILPYTYDRNHDPKSWTFEGSNDNSTWTILDTQTNITVWIAGTKKIYPINNINSYLYYRVNITACNSLTNVIRT